MSTSSRKNVIIAALIVAVAFMSGLLAGIYIGAQHVRRPGRMATNVMLHRMDRVLELTPEQETKIAKILERQHAQIDATVRGQVVAANAEIERLLTPEQREKFKKMRMHLRGHRKRGAPPAEGRPAGAPRQ